MIQFTRFDGSRPNIGLHSRCQCSSVGYVQILSGRTEEQNRPCQLVFFAADLTTELVQGGKRPIVKPEKRFSDEYTVAMFSGELPRNTHSMSSEI